MNEIKEIFKDAPHKATEMQKELVAEKQALYETTEIQKELVAEKQVFADIENILTENPVEAANISNQIKIILKNEGKEGLVKFINNLKDSKEASAYKGLNQNKITTLSPRAIAARET